MDQIRRFFGVERMGSTLEREFIAGAATFFSMSYIIVINPMLLAQAGIPYGAVFFATIISSVACTLFMGLFANVPYVLAPGMSLNSFVALTVVLLLGFRWQEALAMVFLCGLVNVFVTVTRLRHAIIEAIPLYLQNAISMGIGGFIAVAGVRNINVAVDDANRFFLFAGTVALLCVFYVLRLRGEDPARHDGHDFCLHDARHHLAGGAGARVSGGLCGGFPQRCGRGALRWAAGAPFLWPVVHRVCDGACAESVGCVRYAGDIRRHGTLDGNLHAG